MVEDSGKGRAVDAWRSVRGPVPAPSLSVGPGADRDGGRLGGPGQTGGLPPFLDARSGSAGPDAMHPLPGMAPSPILTSAHKIAIAGLGLIGGSLARRLVDRGRFVIAWNHDEGPYEAARLAGIHCVRTLEDLAAGKPDVLVLATPLKVMPEMLDRLAPVLTPSTTLTDVGSVKGWVADRVGRAGLSDHYVGVHPMTGNERSGFSSSDPNLFEGALWAVCVDGGTDFGRFLTVADMITQGVGDELIVMDPAAHDRATALISHMPHVVSTALADTLVDSPDRNLAAQLSAGSWRDMTRVSLTDPERTRAMVEENAAEVVPILREVSRRLTAVAEDLEALAPDSGGGRSSRSEPTADRFAAFFSQAQPYRDYKTAQAGGEGASTSTIDLGAQDWRELLTASAVRGERVERFLTARRVRVSRGPTM